MMPGSPRARAPHSIDRPGIAPIPTDSRPRSRWREAAGSSDHQGRLSGGEWGPDRATPTTAVLAEMGFMPDLYGESSAACPMGAVVRLMGRIDPSSRSGCVPLAPDEVGTA